ncbi:MAG: hypothetical protein Q9219_003014 [cf. Caloplaca sp. 3 TL-2023]
MDESERHYIKADILMVLETFASFAKAEKVAVVLPETLKDSDPVLRVRDHTIQAMTEPQKDIYAPTYDYARIFYSIRAQEAKLRRETGEWSLREFYQQLAQFSKTHPYLRYVRDFEKRKLERTLGWPGWKDKKVWFIDPEEEDSEYWTEEEAETVFDHDDLWECIIFEFNPHAYIARRCALQLIPHILCVSTESILTFIFSDTITQDIPNGVDIDLLYQEKETQIALHAKVDLNLEISVVSKPVLDKLKLKLKADDEDLSREKFPEVLELTYEALGRVDLLWCKKEGHHIYEATFDVINAYEQMVVFGKDIYFSENDKGGAVPGGLEPKTSGTEESYETVSVVSNALS